MNAARITAADSEPGNWMSYGRTYDEQRFSPLQQINAQNVNQLHLAWHYDLDAAHRVQESTPIVVDGVMYRHLRLEQGVCARSRHRARSSGFSIRRCRAATGVKGCCDVGNRGVAVWNGKVYVGTFDGRLVALDAATGKQVWSVSTVDDPGRRSAVLHDHRRATRRQRQGHHRQRRRRVQGARLHHGLRCRRPARRSGVSIPCRASPASATERLPTTCWRARRARPGAASSGSWAAAAPPGTGWRTIPKLDLLYFGTDNGEPWNHAVRGGGDNLFTASIIAVRPDTGEYVWHFQNTPGESWDYSAVQQMTLADLSIDGKVRQVIMQAPKNGFFYVLDRATGEFISAQPYTQINWATGLDPHTGRPDRESAGALRRDRQALDCHAGAVRRRTRGRPCPTIR